MNRGPPESPSHESLPPVVKYFFVLEQNNDNFQSDAVYEPSGIPAQMKESNISKGP